MDAPTHSMDKAVRFRNLYLSIAFFSTLLSFFLIILSIYSEKHYIELKDKQFAVVLKRVNLEKESTNKLQGSLGDSKKKIKALSLEVDKLKLMNQKLRKSLQETQQKLDMVLLESTPKALLPSEGDESAPFPKDPVEEQ